MEKISIEYFVSTIKNKYLKLDFLKNVRPCCLYLRIMIPQKVNIKFQFKHQLFKMTSKQVGV